MKKGTKLSLLIATGVTIASSLMYSTPAQAGLLSAIRSAKWETKKTTHYKLDVVNYDVRVYEWVPEDNKDVRCVFIAGKWNSSGVSCYNVKKIK